MKVRMCPIVKVNTSNGVLPWIATHAATAATKAAQPAIASACRCRTRSRAARNMEAPADHPDHPGHCEGPLTRGSTSRLAAPIAAALPHVTTAGGTRSAHRATSEAPATAISASARTGGAT